MNKHCIFMLSPLPNLLFQVGVSEYDEVRWRQQQFIKIIQIEVKLSYVLRLEAASFDIIKKSYLGKDGLISLVAGDQTQQKSDQKLNHLINQIIKPLLKIKHSCSQTWKLIVDKYILKLILKNWLDQTSNILAQSRLTIPQCKSQWGW